MAWTPFVDTTSGDLVSYLAETNRLLNESLSHLRESNKSIINELRLLNHRFEDQYETEITLEDVPPWEP